MGPDHRRALLWLLLGTLVGCGETANDRDASGPDAPKAVKPAGDAALAPGPEARPDGPQNHEDAALADAGDVGVTAPRDVPDGPPDVPSRPDLGELTRDTPSLT